LDSSITALVIRDEAVPALPLPSNPTLVFSPALIRHRPPVRGRIFNGYPLSKSEEYNALQRAGIPVPKWALLSEDHFPDLSEFDDYLVRKPDHGGRGAEVKIVRKSRVKWDQITTRSAGTSPALILQQFIYTGPQPVCYRVTTLFGKVLSSHRYERRDPVSALSSPNDFRLGGRSIVATTRGCKVQLNYEEDIIQLGELAHAALPNIPLLGFDIVREVPSGKLFVLEANAIGYVWHFSPEIDASFGFSSEGQFDGMRKAAYILAEKTQQFAD
ncbi:MAG TPA: hypothetical protein VIT23_00675, partial [Terrimicrobiaceae bacterium]